MTKTITFPGCWVHIDNDARFLQTAFPDGRRLTSVPMPEKDVVTAKNYGYGDDWLRLWQEHDLLHHWVATLFGHPYSPTIWSVCHEDHPDALPQWARQQEEEFLAHVHRWLNLGIWAPQLWPLVQNDMDAETLQQTARELLSQEMSFVQSR
jgi:hypothetical protein